MSSSAMSPGPHSVTGPSSPSVYFGLSRRGRLTSLAEHEPENRGQIHDPSDENRGQDFDGNQDDGTCQQEGGQMEFFVVRDDSGFPLAARCDKQQKGADNIMHDFIPDSDSGAESDAVPYPMLKSVQQPGIGAHATDSRKQPVRLKSKHSENQPKDQYNFDDSDQDPDYKDDQADSSDSDSSDSDGEPAVKKRKRNPKRSGQTKRRQH